VAELAKGALALLKEQERQAQVRHWLLASGIFLLLGGLIGLAGKVIPASAGWYGVLLSWISSQVRWRSIIVALAAGSACICGAIWLDWAWSYMRDIGWMFLASLALFACWELAARYYTGTWDKPGDGVKPAGA
jgi:hypothetical protein